MINRRQERRRRGPRPLTAAALSAVWPGLGHFRHNNRRALTLFIGTSGAAVLAFLSVAERNGSSLLTWAVMPSRLWIAIIGTSCVLVFRIAVAIDSYRVARRRKQQQRQGIRRIAAIPALIVLLGIIAMPHLFVIRYAVAQLGLLSDVFGTTNTQTAIPTPHTTTTVPAAEATDNTATGSGDSGTSGSGDAGSGDSETSDSVDADSETSGSAGAGSVDAGSAAVDSSATPPAVTDSAAEDSAVDPSRAPTPGRSPPPPPYAAEDSAVDPPRTWYGDERLTIALLGGDSGFDRSGVRTDTIILFSMDVATGDAAAFNIPRNWKDLPFPAGTAAAERWPDGYPGIANEIYGLGLRFPEAFPGTKDPSGHAIKLALAQLTGLSVQYYVLVDMVGFVKAVDLMGGIDIHVTESINDRIKPVVSDGPPIDIVVEPGDHHFDGLTALGYVRSRVASSDYRRMTRQRCVIEALIDQSSYAEVLGNFLALTGIISDHVETDIPSDRLAELLVLSRSLDTSRIATVNFIPPEFSRGSVPIDQVRTAVNQAIQDTDDAKSGASLAVSCQGSD